MAVACLEKLKEAKKKKNPAFITFFCKSINIITELNDVEKLLQGNSLRQSSLHAQ